MIRRMSCAALTLVLLGSATVGQARADGDSRFALLGPNGTGSIRYRDRESDLRLRVEVANLRLPPGSVATVAVDGETIGAMKISERGSGRLEIRSRGRQPLPLIQPGARLEVVAPDGTVVLRGKF
jgi:hypothetical protein